MFSAHDLPPFEDTDLYKRIFQFSPEAMVIINKSGRVIEMNHRMSDWLGYPKRSIVEHHILQLPFLSQDNKKVMVKHFLRRISGQQDEELTMEFMTKDEKKKIGKIKSFVLRNANGQVSAIVLLICEATHEFQEHHAIKRKEEILVAVNYSARSFLRSDASQEDYEKVLKAIGQAASASRVILVINDLLSQRYEWRDKETLSIIREPDYPDLFKNGNKLKEFSEVLQHNTLMTGTRSDFRPSIQAILDQFKIKSFVLLPIFVNNKWWAYICIHDSKEERKWLDAETDALMVATKIIGAAMEKNLTELKLRETIEYWKHEKDRVSQEIVNTQKFKLAVESATDGVMMMSVDRKVIYVNPALEKMTGYDATDVEGKNPDFLSIAKTPHQLISKLWETLANEKPFVSDEIIITKKDGSDLPVRMSVFAISEHDKAQFYVGVLEDITRRREIDRMKTEFISIASHQLNTPLSAMKWFLELLQVGKAGPLNPKQQDFVQNLVDSNLRMISLVRSLLNISRIESGRIIIDPHLTDVREMIQDVIDEVKPFFDKKKQKVTLKIDPQISKVVLDPRLIRNVYLNLLTNSSKYSPEGTEVLIQVEKKEREMVSHVIDQGLGIPKADQDKIFTRFFRAANVVRLETDGSGLGMYLVKIVIESSGGKVWLESEENKGTDVGFSLPLHGVKAKPGDVFIDESVYS